MPDFCKDLVFILIFQNKMFEMKKNLNAA